MAVLPKFAYHVPKKSLRTLDETIMLAGQMREAKSKRRDRHSYSFLETAAKALQGAVLREKKLATPVCLKKSFSKQFGKLMGEQMPASNNLVGAKGHLAPAADLNVAYSMHARGTDCATALNISLATVRRSEHIVAQCRLKVDEADAAKTSRSDQTGATVCSLEGCDARRRKEIHGVDLARRRSAVQY